MILSVLRRTTNRPIIRVLIALSVLTFLFVLSGRHHAHQPSTLSDDHINDSPIYDLGAAKEALDALEDDGLEDAGVRNGQNKADSAKTFNSETETVLSSLEQHRLSIVGYTPEDYATLEKRMGMIPGTLPQSKSAYFSRLRGTVDKWFTGLPIHEDFIEIIDRYESRDMQLDNLPRVISSTDKDGPGGVPEGFEIWSEIASPEEGWRVDVMDDGEMERRMTGWSGGDGTTIKGIWEKLDFTVLKTDLVRYFLLLLEGGIYTDSDTVPRAHPFDWGKPAKDKTDQMISMLDSNLSFMRHLHAHIHNPTKGTSKKNSGGNTIRNADVSLILSLEDNRWDEDDTTEWHGGTEIPYRKISFCQWTMMSKKGHLVWIDVIGDVLNNLEWAITEGKLDGSIHATQLTGPAVFSDAMYRYLLIQYGVTPHDLVKLRTRQAYRIGDVVIYGPGSFGPMYKHRTDHVVGDITMPVGHMYKGRWKSKGWD